MNFIFKSGGPRVELLVALLNQRHSCECEVVAQVQRVYFMSELNDQLDVPPV